MTEFGPAVTFLYEDEQLTKAGSAGKVCINHELRVVRPREGAPSEPDDICAPGEIGEIHHPWLLHDGRLLQAGGSHRRSVVQRWYHSGDLGYLDEDGYLWVADRLKDMVISGGENIYPREVEDVLYEHPGVLDVAVWGNRTKLGGSGWWRMSLKKTGGDGGRTGTVLPAKRKTGPLQTAERIPVCQAASPQRQRENSEVSFAKPTQKPSLMKREKRTKER